MAECPFCGFTNGLHEPLCLQSHSVASPRRANVRPTSRMAYFAARDDGTLGAQQQAILAHLRTTGSAMTGRELDEHFQNQSMHKRLAELSLRGLIEESTVRPCRVTGKRSVAWRAASTAGSRTGTDNDNEPWWVR